ncbi:T9SS type A sorting domain-containing protein [Foetidibacter luteolus]|uniref:T9SS type A sorting domain-containing protein n=1 Tax=Foetidibacter luteolus TaxID=2608880 RepID=UPI00129B6F7B|nr:T9SS type A sorting domain-containing protein [Foetidibacter luteolus]
MKSFYLVPLMVLLAVCNKLKAAETEPNNTSAQASTLSLNGSNTGKISSSTDVDWWKVTTTGNGKLDITLKPNNKFTWLYLYDANGTTVLDSSNSNTSFTRSTDGLAAGIYYIKVRTVTASDTTSYTISNTLTLPAQANDVGVNDTKAQALTLAQNSTKTGHLGYYYNNKRDTADWYKITTTTTRYLRIKLTPANGQPLNVTLYTSNGTSIINSATSANVTLNTDGLLPDTYYLKLKCQSTSGFAPYTLTDSTYTPKSDTLTLPVNYVEKSKIATAGAVRWWRLKTSSDGKLSLTLTPSAGKYMWIYLYDRNGTTLLNSSYSSSKFTQTTDGLAAGTYLVKINSYYPADTSSYILADTLRSPAQANDVEPNDTRAQALTLNLNSTKTGHVGYYYNNKRDTADWYKVTTNANGLVRLKLTPHNGYHVWAYLYDNNGTTLLKSGYSTTTFYVDMDGLAAGTYYIRVNCYYNNQFAPYTLTDSLLKPTQANDVEPNDTRAQAVSLALNGTKTGHVGYYYNNKRDTADWYKITTTADGLVKLKLTPHNGSYLWAYLYDNNGTTLINSAYSNAAFTMNTDGLAAGTYYVKVNCYYNNHFTPYTLTDSLYTPAQANDTEPNDNRAQALTLAVNSTKTGHAGYYYNNKRDTADWYKVTTTSDGMVKLKLTPHNGSYLWVYLYDNNGTTLLNSAYSNAAFSMNTDGLAAGTYYLKVNCYYNNQFTPYTLTDSLYLYPYANDAEPNNKPYQALTMAANTTVTGHTNFYYKLLKDGEDWWKLNYTGTGSLKFTFNLAAKKVNSVIPYVWLYVYKDTAAAPVYSGYFNTASNVINLTSLAKANYYIRVVPYYNTDWTAYSIVNSFTAGAPLIVTAPPDDNVEIALQQDDVRLFPNPATTQFRVQFSGNPRSFTSISLRDAGGRQVWSQANTMLSLKSNGLDVNVASLQPGIYFLTLVTAGNQVITKKVVVSK